MPAWLTVLLGVAGGLNVVGLAGWVVKSIYDLRARIALVEAAMTAQRQTCILCGDDKKEIFRKLNRLNAVQAAMAEKLGIRLGDFVGE